MRVVICGMGTDGQGDVGISIPGAVKAHLEKIMSKMTPALKLFLLGEEGLIRSPSGDVATEIFL